MTNSMIHDEYTLTTWEPDVRYRLDIFRQVRKNLCLNDGNYYHAIGIEDPFVAEFVQETRQTELWLDALRAIRAGRFIESWGEWNYGYGPDLPVVSQIGYHKTFNPEWGSGACWDDVKVWHQDEDEKIPWVIIEQSCYP